MQGARNGGLDLAFIQGGRVTRVMNIYLKIQFVQCEPTHLTSIQSKLTEITNSLERRSEKHVGRKLVRKFNAF